MTEQEFFKQTLTGYFEVPDIDCNDLMVWLLIHGYIAMPISQTSTVNFPVLKDFSMNDGVGGPRVYFTPKINIRKLNHLVEVPMSIRVVDINIVKEKYRKVLDGQARIL